MTDTFVKLLNPLEPAKAQTLIRLSSLAGRLGVPVLVVGACARDINFWHIHGIETARKTRDVDLSVRMSSWTDFDAFTDALVQAGFSRPNRGHPEKHTDIRTGQEVDILPFGDISRDGKTITWPGERHSWGVIGFVEAYDHALTVSVTVDGMTQAMRVATLPAIVMMKIVALHDRPDDRKQKDGADIAFIIKNYLNAGAAQRLREMGPVAGLSDIRDDLLLVAAYLLGADIRELAEPATLDELLSLIRAEVTSRSRCHLAHRVSEEIGQGSFSRARQILGVIVKGMENGL